MQSFVHPVISVASTQFVEALATNVASAVYNLPLPLAGSRAFLIRSLMILAKENYGPELHFFGKSAGPTVDPATDTEIGYFGFTSAMGEQLGGAGLWRYRIDGLAIPYTDLDWLTAAGSGGAPPNPPTLHTVLQNISATGKSGGAAGSTKVIVFVEPQVAY